MHDIPDSKYTFEHQFGDTKIKVEFTEDTLDDVIDHFARFLRAVSFNDELINRYILTEE